MAALSNDKWRLRVRSPSANSHCSRAVSPTLLRIVDGRDSLKWVESTHGRRVARRPSQIGPKADPEHILADSNLKPKSSNVWVEIFVVRGCTSRPRWRCPAGRIKYHEKCVEHLYRADSTHSGDDSGPPTKRNVRLEAGHNFGRRLAAIFDC